ncbi:MAG: hypothetical protein ABEH35_08440 [Haloarculaceae archaeon]
MLEDLSATCAECDRTLDKSGLMLSMRTDGGERRAYECACGAVTVTVARNRHR